MTTATWWDHWTAAACSPTTADERDCRIGKASIPFARRGRPRIAFSDLSLALKVALIPALTLLVMGVMLAVAAQMGERNTAALRALDHDVFEPLNRAQTTKDGITLLHAHLFALLSLGNNEFDPVAQRARAEKLVARLDAETKDFSRFLDETSAVPPDFADRLRARFAAYAMRVRETIDFAAYDSSYGALHAGITDDQFGLLSANLDALVQLLAQRRLALAEEAVGGSLNARHLLLGLGIGAAMLVLLGSVVVGRSIARPVLGLTTLMNRLAGGDTDLAVPGSERRDEVGAMARAVEVFRANAIAHRLGEFALRRTNLLFDAALNSMQQGLIVWSPDDLRATRRTGATSRSSAYPRAVSGTDMTVREAVEISISHGNHPGQEPSDVCDKVTSPPRH